MNRVVGCASKVNYESCPRWSRFPPSLMYTGMHVLVRSASVRTRHV